MGAHRARPSAWVLSGFQQHHSWPGPQTRVLEAPGKGRPPLKARGQGVKRDLHVKGKHFTGSLWKVKSEGGVIPPVTKSAITGPAWSRMPPWSCDWHRDLSAPSTEGALDRHMPDFRNGTHHFVWSRNAAAASHRDLGVLRG